MGAPAIPPPRPNIQLPQIKDVEFDNWSFEHGLDGWTADGTAFQKQPTFSNNVTTQRVQTGMEFAAGGIGGDYWKNQPYPIGIKGTYWIGTFEARPDANTTFGTTQGDQATGTLTSLPFTITKKFCEFLLGGGNDTKLFVELQIEESKGQFKTVAQKMPVRNSEELQRIEIDLQKYIGKTARIRIVDNATGPWGHINVDDFRFVDQKTPGIELTAGTIKYRVDADAPVWGFADTHAHPTAQHAFGKKIYVGDPMANPAQTFSTDTCVKAHGIGGYDKVSNDGFTKAFDEHTMAGWPDLIEFPRFNGKTHQKYHVDFIKRAWQGGLRLMSALAVHNMYIASRGMAHPHDKGEANDDETIMYRELNDMIAMARANSDWMEIAREPAEARRIIRQGKLAIVLGVENDVFGNFKSPDAKWDDEDGSKKLVAITDSNADALLDKKLAEYYKFGIRQVLPIHYLSKPFAGTAVFNGSTFLPQVAFYDNVNVKNGVPRGVGFSLYEDFNAMAVFLASGMVFKTYADHIIKRDQGAEVSMVNADGLTPIGEKLFTKLMDRHFIVDVEHGSYETKDGIFRISAAHGNYPVIASHVDPLALAFAWVRSPIRWPGGLGDRIANFGTSNIRNIGHEMQLSDDNYANIQQRNGTVGVFLSLNRKRTYSGRKYPHIPDGCSGSTTTFAQMYLHSLDKMNGRGVALASDFPMLDTLSPRFGAFACWGMALEEDDKFKKEYRKGQRMAQLNGVRYDRPSGSYNPRLFEKGNIDDVREEDVYKALAAWKAGARADSLANSTDPVHIDRVRNLAKGLYATSAAQLAKPGLPTDEGPAEQGAMFLLKKQVENTAIVRGGGAPQPDPLQGLAADHIASINKMANQIRPAFNLWLVKDGSNEQLRRAKTGNRDWDYNIDGLAHYGLVPDMLQDLVNIGVKGELIWPLFGSAEDYIEMWELAKNNRLARPTAPVGTDKLRPTR